MIMMSWTAVQKKYGKEWYFPTRGGGLVAEGYEKAYEDAHIYIVQWALHTHSPVHCHCCQLACIAFAPSHHT